MDASKCQTPGCEKPAKLRCPKCMQLKLPDAHFCSQECFKAFWPIHKTVHDAPAEAPRPVLPEMFNGYQFTGPLRPGLVSPRRTVPATIRRPDYADTGKPESEIRIKSNNTIEVHTPEQIEKIKRACRLGREVLDIAAAMVKPGVTTDEIDRVVHEATIEREAYPSPLNYYGFPKSCCTSVNEVICHGIPDSRALVEGDIVNLDISLYIDGFHADLNETYFVGNVDEKSRHLVQSTYECMMKGIEIVKPGVLYREVGNVIQKHATANGLSVVRTYCGHGIGANFHAPPNVPHYAKNKAVGVMKPGHIFTIEPMINEGTWHDVTWPDEWTSTTKDGKRSAQFEHTVLVTETGHEILTARFPTSPHSVQ